MDKELMKEAEALGINASTYYFLPPDKREAALKQDVERAKKISTTEDE